MSTVKCSCLLLQLALVLAAVRFGAAIRCHRSVCLDDANITACTTNHTTQLVDCGALSDDSNSTDNATACVKYSVTGATYRRMSGSNFSPCDSLEVRTCFEYHSDAGLDLGGRLGDAMRYAGANETVLDVHVCHVDGCNAARRRDLSAVALLAAALGIVVSWRVRC